MNITERDRNSPLWIELESEFKLRIDSLRKKNDAENLSEIETATIRGRIKELKSLLMMGKKVEEVIEG